MKGSIKLFGFLIWAALLLGAGARPIAAAAAADLAPSTNCNLAGYYIYNGSFEEVYIDVANWSTGTRATIFSLPPGQSTRFKLEPGWIEFYVVHWDLDPDREWQTGAWELVNGCDQVAAYIKFTTGPEFTVKIKPGNPE